ncbi:MAG: lysophospholipase [Deltaproteobacteria bacterium]|nr:lysophospholipase [Deltaproteobacteria bacterium]
MERLPLHSRDGLRLSAGQWRPAGTPRGEVVLLHGLAEHIGRYEHVGAALASAGYRVLAVELRGHGRSDGPRGHVAAWEDYVADARALIDQLEGDRWALLAHSMGGLVAMELLREGGLSTPPLGMILSGPLLGVAVKVPAWKSAMGRQLSRWLPTFSLPSGLEPANISSDPAVVRAYVEDPLVYPTVTARWFTEMSAAIARSEAFTPALPMWIGWGDEDRIVSIDAIQALVGRAPQAQVHPWPGMRHEILNEPAQGRVIASMRAWLDDRFEGREA